MNADKDLLCLVVCENIAPEVATAIAAEKMHDVAVAIFSARCDLPTVDQETLDQAARVFRHSGQRICLVGRCGQAGLGDADARQGEQRLLRTDTCARLFIPRTLFDHYASMDACLLLPGELAHWEMDRHRWTALTSATRLLLLDTGVDAGSVDCLKGLARHTGLSYEVVPVGLDFFRLFLAKIVLEWRLDEGRSHSTAALSEAIRRSSDHAMALDLISGLTRIVTEAEAIESILELFTLLFAPGRLVYVPLNSGLPGEVRAYPAPLGDPQALLDRLASMQGDYNWIVSRRGFLLRIGYQEETLGLLEIDEVAFPEHLQHYLSLALILGRVCGLTIANARAYEKSKQAEAQIRHQAYHDALTGLPNRLLFNDHLTAALAKARRTQSLLAVLFVDLDNFKRVNDSLGHDTGDQLLKKVTGRLLGAVRTGDTVARMGGDEFLLLLPQVGKAEDAIRIGQRIRQSLQPPFDLAGHEVQMTTSVGIALYPQDGQDAEALLKNADTALYRAKEAGKDRCSLYGEA